MSHKRSEEFIIGQRVSCVDPDEFLQPTRNYLKDRTGVVTKVYPPERPDEYYCGLINQVRVLWGKRGGRGKEKEITMYPRDLIIVGEKP